MNVDLSQGDALALYEYAKRLLREHPDGPLPGQGLPLPDHDTYYRQPVPNSRAREAGAARIGAAVGAYFGGGADYADLCQTLVSVFCPPWHELISVLEPAISGVEFGRVLALGRRLTRTGTDRRPVQVGLVLLQGVAEAEDVDCISALAILGNSFSPSVVEILKRMPDPDTTLWWIARRTTAWARVYPVEALCRTTTDPAIKAWLLRHSVTDDPLSGYYAGEVAVSCDLRGALEVPEPDEALLDGAEAILHAMDRAGGMGPGLEHYHDAVPVLRRFLQFRESPPLRAALARLPPGPRDASP
ncbi:hypothetical protein D0T12_22010 [Actinomadura spongiicola]|uniref:HEAT repeat domain-containing protein n=1 Tax=Actinomadura spongiicola TaxID=2303421 RepID=A0A372GE85_9ACTN|nr:hypothetical protein [Actinomadura spongiicola]RFS83691.1 hypothetical protein D0T12_22010 [Actinomadura spongiicola]